MTGFSLILVGWNGVVVALLALAAAWIVLRLQRGEIAHLPSGVRRGLAVLRATAVVLVALLLAEPALAWHGTRLERPSVAVLIDRSGSMDATDERMSADRKLDEAVALGLVPADARQDAPRRAARALAAAEADRGGASAALTALAESRTPAVDALGLARRQDHHQAALTAAAEALGAASPTTEHVRACASIAGTAATALRGGGDAKAALSALAAQGKATVKFVAALERRQSDLDAALVAGAGPDAPVIKGLTALDRLPRDERVRRLVEAVLRPALGERADFTVHAADERLTDLATGVALSQPASGVTDLAAPLAALARSWANERHVAAAVLISDGRQTAGSDPVPAIRALGARGATLHTVVIGDPKQPRDAVVADLRVAEEVFLGERLRLEAVWRVSGYDGSDWSLILSCDGSEVERRTVRASPSWAEERFDRPPVGPGAENRTRLGPHAWSVRIERLPGSSGSGGLRRERWTGISDPRLAGLLANPAYPGQPATIDTLSSIDLEDNHADYGQRIRGYLVPPETGDYVLWLAGDDECELRLAPGADAADASVVCRVKTWTTARQWDKEPGQRSQPIRLEAGKRAYLEVLHKQGQGGANLAVGWTLPGGAQERPIPATRYAPWTNSGTVTDQPEASLANNQVERTVTVVNDPLQVLIIDAGPRWDVRYLTAQFERDRRVQVVRRFRDVHLAAGGPLLPAGPQALDAFDIIVLGDVPSADLAPDDQDRLARFVARRGGFLLALSGPRGMPAGYGLGGVADLLPVRPVQVGSSAKPTGVRLGPDAAQTPITQILEDAALNARLWPALPKLTWLATGLAPKPGAAVLLVTDEPIPAPVVVVGRHGAGRVLWSASDETWRWRDRIGERVHQTFWAQAIRWGLGARLRGTDPRLQVALDRGRMDPAERAELRVSCRDRAGQPLAEPPRVYLSDLDDPQQEPRSLDLIPVDGVAGLWQAILANLPVGRWGIEAAADPDGDRLSEMRQLDVRRAASAEGADLSSDPANLARLARAGGGKATDVAGLADLVTILADGLEPRRVPVDRTWSLWDNPTPLLLLLALLTGEWLVRRRHGLP